VLALPDRAGISLGLLGDGFTLGERGLIGRVAHPWRGVLGEHRLHIRAELRGGSDADLGHPVGLLTPHHHGAFTRPILIGKHPVGVDLQRQPMRHPAQLVGAHHQRLVGQEQLGRFAHLSRHVERQRSQELLNDPHMLKVERAVTPRVRGTRLVWWQRFTGQRGPRV
jgi:hypothetical protein